MKRKIINLLRNKRGMAIELAIFVMLVVVSLSALLVTVSVLNRTATESLATKIDQRIYLDQIGESFVVAVKTNQNLDSWADGITDYSATTESLGDATTLSLTDSLGNVKLSVILESCPNGYKITQWKYS